MNKNKRNIIIAVVLLILLCIAPFWPNNVRDEAGFLRLKTRY